MNSNISQKKLYYIIIALTALVVVLFIALNLFDKTKKSKQISQVDFPPLPKYRSIIDLPLLPESRGYGVDVESNFVKESISTIQKLDAFLPYQKFLTTVDGVDIEVLIISTKFADNNWTLNAFVFGPDYRIPKADPQYQIMKRAFLIGVNDVFSFLTEKKVDTSKLIIQWGERKFIRDRAEEWLNN